MCAGDFVACGLPRREGTSHTATIKFSTSLEGLLSGKMTKYEIDSRNILKNKPAVQLVLNGKCKRLGDEKKPSWY